MDGKRKTYPLWEREEFTYQVLGDFAPTLTAYIHEDAEQRPAFVVVPGGGYRMVSASEGEIVAKKFFDKGFQSFVLTYTTCMPGPEPLRLQPLKDLSRAIVMIRKKAEVFRVKRREIVVCGFSAGAHLCGSLAVHFEEPKIQEYGVYKGISNRPDYAVLCYPVITSGEFSHKDSFVALLGEEASSGERYYMSLEKHVTKETPPVFLWQTASDETVPVQNSYLFAEACRNAGVAYEHHVFRKGMHGLSLADEVWAQGEYGGLYCMKQLGEYIEYCRKNKLTPVAPFDGLLKLPEGMDVLETFAQGMKVFGNYKPEPSVKIWPELVENWLLELLSEL